MYWERAVKYVKGEVSGVNVSFITEQITKLLVVLRCSCLTVSGFLYFLIGFEPVLTGLIAFLHSESD